MPTTAELIEKHKRATSSGGGSTADLIAKHKKLTEPKRAKTPEFESFLRGGAQGVTLGFADEIAGALEAAKDVAVGPTKFENLLDQYRKRRDESRLAYKAAQQDSPYWFGAGEFGGGLATTAIPGMALAKGASIGQKLGTAAKLGGAVGLGAGEADITKGDIGGAAGEAAMGATTGAVLQGGLSGLGAAAKSVTPTNVAKKLGNVFLNAPEQITEKYMRDPAAIKGAPLIHEVGTEFAEEAVPALKRLTTEGSAASRALLAKEGKTIPRSRIAQIYDQAADDILEKSEGVISDPQKAAAYKAFKQQARKFTQDVDPVTGEVIPENLTTNRLKDELQSLDRMVEYKIGPGAFGKVDSNLKKQVRKQLDTELKTLSPEYKKMMPEVAADAELLNKATDLSKSPAGFTNLFKRLARDEYGTGQIPRKTLELIDQRLGTNYVQRAENAMVKEAFDKSLTQGSMNVNKFAAMLRDVPVIKYIAPLVGATVDKYGRKLTMAAVDSAMALQRLADTGNAQKLQSMLEPLVKTAQAGNKAAAITLLMFNQANPNFDYGRIKAEQEGLYE